MDGRELLSILDIGRGGSGLFGGSEGLVAIGLAKLRLSGGGLLGGGGESDVVDSASSLDGGDGGMVSTRFPPAPASLSFS